MMSVNIPNEQMLYLSYLPFLKDGGLFIPTDKAYKLGDEIFLMLTLLQDSEKYPVPAKVVWINPKAAQGGRPAGIGVHFSGQKKDIVRDKIESTLANKLNSDKRTYTM
ncbi:MAG: PilZ domain-containing protein [Thiotrichaceae bacterium]|nr:PilZ domain-containing protein [Thiotrichaceae bacterium]